MINYDVIIIGAGIVGSLTARFLSRCRLKILLIDKASDVGTGPSCANSAIVHTGFAEPAGTLKAKMNIRANPMWDQLAGELNFPFVRCGDYVVAVGTQEFAGLDGLLEQGRANGVPGVQIISGAEMRRREPLIHPDTSGALWSPTGGICDVFAATYAAAENAVENGVQLMLNTAFEDFIFDGRRIVGIKTSRGNFGCRWAVNSAGLHSDEVMHRAGVRPEFEIKPRRGEYAVLDRSAVTVNNVLFPMPTIYGKGILVTNTVQGNAIIGPTVALECRKDERQMTALGLDEITAGARRLMPSLDLEHVIGHFSGLRCTGNARCETPGMEDYPNDFIIEIPAGVEGFVNLGGIESPGVTSAPAIALRVIEMLKDAGENLRPRRDWNPIREARPRFSQLSRARQAELIERDPSYARVICRCEMVTEGEIIAEMRAPIPARTYDALKRRTGLGSGRCQGGFDLPRVTAIMARELGVSPLEICKRGPGSGFLTGKPQTGR